MVENIWSYRWTDKYLWKIGKLIMGLSVNYCFDTLLLPMSNAVVVVIKTFASRTKWFQGIPTV